MIEAPATDAASPTRPDADVVIQTRNLTKDYRDFWGRQKVRALKALDLEVRQGEIFGLLGPNGSGKTTTIKLLLGLLFPTSGEALVFGRKATDVSEERANRIPARGVVSLQVPERRRDARFLRPAVQHDSASSSRAGAAT